MLLCLSSSLSLSSAPMSLKRGVPPLIRGLRRGCVFQPDLLKYTNKEAEDLICIRLTTAAKLLQEMKDLKELLHLSVLHYEDLYALVHKRFPAGYTRVSSLVCQSLALSVEERDQIYAHYEECLYKRRARSDDDDDDDKLFLDYVLICYKQLLFMEEEFMEVQRKVACLHRNYNILLLCPLPITLI